jgi:hypothetical protein
MTRGRAHPPELRASAEALLLAGKTQSEVCSITGLPKQTVSRMAAGLGEQLGLIGTAKKEAYGDLIMGYFSAALRAMISQAEVAGDPEYCRKHDPDKVAILHGVIGDKLAGIATTAQALGLIGTPSADPALPSGDSPN